MYKDGDFKWVDKSGFDFSNFASGFPKNTEHFWDCGQIFTGLKIIHPDNECLLTSSPPLELSKFSPAMKWQDAEAHCTKEQGHLVSIHSEEEHSFITGIVQQSPTGISLWMGGHDSITEGGWEWTDGSPFRYIHWNAGNPDDYFGEDCLSILINSGYWNDDNCDNKRGYICEKRGDLSFLMIMTLKYC
uniref:C-type lectin domain-containing protein n=1 Tax=Neogobius melanostomus TaxID=47308 RepID=A0A8C6S314_9GOBI